MARRVSVPSADELFRPTTDAPEEPVVRAVPDVGSAPRAAKPVKKAAPAKKAASRRTSGRVRHDEKMTVYVTSDELLELEHARLALRSAHGLAVDRGRIVREAVALVLADLEAHGEESALVRRLTEE
ncbi:hypothetical protein [Nocardioides daphniae]|uniref:Cobyrinic acid a,c-diamide synthase n=1 Tax=Nocardioides daphniae TaxID=402297 RepID=A0A4P7UAQ3_9ACTN|nr:hypothetical protein [Nocardioides daphniae]QCC77173.1 hypothetical protein E2C04_08055 [Nocardioides daphniae]GGD27158.1 hypothetical protein GCM10007231_28240 [Nocardioides daphniae]